MLLPGPAKRVVIHLNEDAASEGDYLHLEIVSFLFAQGVAGATVLRGVMGFGNSRRLHTWKILRLYEDMPLIVEIVDTEEKIKSFLPTLDAMMPSGIVTLGRVQVSQYRADVKQEPS